MKYLLLGGSGFIGSHLAKRLTSEGHDAVVAGREQLDFTKCTDFTKYIKDVDVIVHMISTIIPSDNTSKIDLEIEDNVKPTLALFRDASRLNKKIVFISSGGAVYGESKTKNKENGATNPICNYGIVKLMIEKYLALYHDYYGLEYRIVRPSNPYSGKVYHDKKQGVIPIIIDNTKQEKPIMLYGDEQTRDYIYIDDLINGIDAVLKYKGKQRIFNIGSGVGHTTNDIVKIVEGKLGKKAKIKKASARKCDVIKNVLDIDLIYKETGWRPEISLEKGIEKIIRELYV